ncbi:glutamate-rich protein 3 isoform X1 [Pelobates fuscus]|uniref:glutamate-rich protein 3 isoform X1 n=1 Tax=Pelobates fuscus TaxID=191477 RepID=UPI002FE431FC
MSHPYHGPLSAYNSLMDRHLTGYFNNTRIKRHLQRAGLITRNGRILSEKEYRLNAMRRDHQKYIRECLAQAIFHKVLDMERHHQIEIKRKLESFARKERVQRTKVDHSKSAEEDTGPVFSPRPPTGPRSGLNRQMTTQVEGSDSSESASSPRPNTAPGGMQRPYRLRPLQGYSSYGNVPKTSSGSRHKQSSDDTEQHFSKGVDRDIWKLINTMDHPGEISPYRLPIINNFVMPAPPPPQKRPKHGASYSSRGRRFRPTTAPNEHEVSSKDPKKFPKPSLHSNVKITMIYLGKNVHLSFEDDDYRDEVKIFQQHCGGENLCVFKGRLLEGESFSLISRRHRGFPFSLTFFINGMQVDRLSSCCEYKHRKGARLGGRNGHFGFTDIEGASPCYRCIIAMGLDKKPLPPPKKTTEEMSDSEDEKDERKDDSAVEDDVSEQKSHVDDEKMEQRSPRTSSPYDAEKEADDTKKDMEYEEEGEDTNDETRVCTDTYEADDETKDEYDEDFEVEEEKSDEKHNEEGQAYDEVEEKSKSPSDDEKDDLEHEKESNKSSKLKVQTPDSQKDERDGHSESENEGDKQENKHDTESSSSASSISSSSSEDESDYDGDGEETSRKKTTQETKKVQSRKASLESEKPSTPSAENQTDDDPLVEETENKILELQETSLEAKASQLSDIAEEPHQSRTASRQNNLESPSGSGQETDSEHDDTPSEDENIAAAEEVLDNKPSESEDEEECKSVQEKIAEAMGQGESVESEPEASDTSTDEEDTFKRPFMAHKLTAENIIPETNELTAESNDVKDLEENSKIEALEETEKPEEQMTEENEMTADNTLSEEETRQEHLLNEDLKIELEQEKDEEEVIMDHSNIAEEPPQEVDEEDYEAFNDELLREALNEDLADEAELKNSNDDNEIGDLTDLTLEPIEDSEMAEEFRGIEGEKTTNEIKALEEETMEVSAYSSLNSMLVSHTEESTSNLDELNEKDEDLNSLKDHDELVSERDSTKEITENLLASSSSFANTNSADGPNQNQETGNSGNELLEKESDLLFTDQTSDGTAEDADSELNMEQQFEMPVVSSKSDPLSVSHIESEETVDNVDNENNLSSSYITEVKEALNNADISEDIKTKDDIQEEEISDIMASDKESNAPVTDAMNTETDTEMVMGEPDANPSSPEERKVFDNEEEITASGETSNVELTTEILESQENLEESMESKAEDDLDVMGLNNEQITEIPVAENDDQPDGGARTEQPIPNEELGNSAVEMAVEGISAEEMKRPANFVEGVGNVDEDKEGDFCDSEDKETTENAENMTSEGENASNKLIQDEEMVASDVRMTEHDVTDDVEETKEAVLMDPITDMKNVTDDKEDVSIDDFPNGNLESTAKDESVVENLEFTDGGTNNDHIATADRVEKEDISATANEKEGLPDVEIEDAPVENGSETEVVNLTDEGVVDTHSVKGEEIDNNEKETFSEGYFGDQELTNDTIGDDIDEHTESDMANIENTSKYALSEENAAIKNEEEIDNTATGESDLICEDEPKEESAVTHFSTADNISENDQIGIINHDNIEDQTKEEHESQVSNSTNLILNTEKDASEHDDSVVEAEVLKDASEHEDSAVEAEVLKDASEHEDSAVEAEVLKDASEHEDSVVEAEVLKDASEHEDSVVEAEVLKDASEHEDSAVEAEVLKDASEHEAETNTPKEESEEKEKDDGENGNSTDVTQVSNVIDGGKDLEKLDHDTEVEDNGKDINDSGTEIGQNNMLEPSAPDEIEIANVDAKISEPKEEENPEEKETSSATNEVTDQ